MKIKIMSMVLLFFANTSLYAMEYGVAGHKPGEVIAVHTDDEIAALCDFDRQIVMTATRVLCVFRGNNSTLSSD